MMKPSVKRLVDRMKNGVVQFQYKKKGTQKIRKAKGTLDKKIVPEVARKRKTKRPVPKNSVVYYDLERGAIRSFKDYLLMRVWKRNVEAKKNSSQKT